jgi:3-hydroxyisobutyrate dehydrogenase
MTTQGRETARSASGPARVALLGTGLMGSAMAARLLGQGVPVVVWDRTAEHARPLADRGAEVAGSPGEAVAATDVVITMLPTAQIVTSVVEPLLGSWPATTIWLQMSSVGATRPTASLSWPPPTV